MPRFLISVSKSPRAARNSLQSPTVITMAAGEKSLDISQFCGMVDTFWGVVRPMMTNVRLRLRSFAMPELGGRAVVLGASMGGLLAARVLADFFGTVTVVERDELPDDPAVRRGVPQGRHVHVLLARGGQILDELFPGFLDELVADGAPVWDDGDLSKLHLSFGGHDILRSGKVAKEPKALAIHIPSRPFLEYS